MTIHPQPVQHLPAYSATQIQAVSRLDAALSAMQAEGTVTAYRLGEWFDNEIRFFVTVPEDKFFTEPLLTIIHDLKEQMGDLDVYLHPYWSAD